MLVNDFYGGRVCDKSKQQKGQHPRQRRCATTAFYLCGLTGHVLPAYVTVQQNEHYNRHPPSVSNKLPAAKLQSPEA